MKDWKIWRIALFTAFCILLNFAGREIADRLALPLWLDSFGTCLAAMLGGPFVGAVVGVSGNLLFGIFNHAPYVYAVISLVIGVIVGISAERNAFDSLLGATGCAMMATIASIAVSVPLNLLYSGGAVGNVWGDGVKNYMLERGYPLVLCTTAGEFYVDFLDKILTLVILYILIFLMRKGRKKGANPAEELTRAAVLALAAGITFSAKPVRAEDQGSYLDYVQTVYSSTNGLPCGEANDIAATSDGILWIGTYAGLYRYNGSEFRWMNDYDSVRNVNCLYVDREGRLFIGTNDNGLTIAIGEKVVNVLDQDGGLPSNSVRCIVQGADGYYYIGTTGSMQVLTLNGGLKTVTTIREINYSDDIAADEAGHIACVTSDGRLFLLRGGQIQSSLMLSGDGEIFKACGFDQKGRLMAGTTAGNLIFYDISNGHFEERGTLACEGLSSINDLYLLDGQIFVSADNGIGYLDEAGSFQNIALSEFNNSIDNMLVDYQGNLWFTSSRLGLLRLAPSAFRDVCGGAGISAKVVNSSTVWQNRLYIGTDKGLDIVDQDTRSGVADALTEDLKDVRIRCILADSADHLWICTYGQGLLEVMPDGTRYLYNADNGGFGNRARLVTELSDGTIAAAGDTGMSFISDHKILTTIGYEDGLINSMILSVMEMKDGRILAGTDGDGIAVLEDGQVRKMLTREDGLSSGVILRIVKDPKAEAFFLVTSNGLCYMDESGEIRQLEHFPYFNNYDIWAKDAETLFVLGSAGIYVVSRDDLVGDVLGMSYDLLDARKGLSSALTANSWNYDDGEGALFLSTDRGVYVLDTEAYSAENRSYRMEIAAVYLDGEERLAESGRPITVGRGISRVDLYPEVINFSVQDPYVGYYLEGFEETWNIESQSAMNGISYTNLPSGEYTFRLAVFDSNKTRLLEERSYTLIKEEEIYDKRYFKFYMIFVALAAVAWCTWYFVFQRLQRMVEQQRQQMEIQEKELAMARRQAQMGDETIIAIAKAVDAKDIRTSQHSERVSQYSVMIGERLGLSEEDIERLRKTARMHDIGKIGIPDAILNKPGRLTDEEYAIMKSHTTRGGEILKGFTLLGNVIEGAQSHHERYDGRGYPDGLKGEEIPLFARIIGTADAFDAMTANRVYRKQLDFDYVLNEMRNGRGTQFDPQMVDILLALIDEGKVNLKELYPELGEEEEGRARMTDAEARRLAEAEAGKEAKA